MSAEDETAKMATEEFVAEYNDEHKIQPYSGTPKKDGVASAGDASTGFACGDHVHPTDTSRMSANATGANIAVSGSDTTKIAVALAGKADKDTTYTKTEVDEKIGGFVDGAEYNSTTKKILLKHGTTTVAEVDATSFIKDGMVSSVGVVGGNIVITFNTDAGLEPIEIPLTDIFDPDNYYDKDAVDALLDDKQDALTFDNAPTSGSDNPVKSGGIWRALWGALSALPTGFSSLYDWCVSQLAGKVPTSRTVNGKALSSDVTLTGADIAVSESDETTIDDALAGKLDKSGGTMTGSLILNSATGSVTIGVIIRNSESSSAIAFSSNRINLSVGNNRYEILYPLANGTFALAASNPTAGNLAALDADGNPTDSTIPAANVAVKGEIPYALTTRTIRNNTVTLNDRASNAVTISATLSPNTLTINFPTAPTGKLRDFAMRLNIAAGVTAPELALPQGVTCENADGAAPEIGADGAATILYFTETAANVFLVKGEVVTAIS